VAALPGICAQPHWHDLPLGDNLLRTPNLKEPRLLLTLVPENPIVENNRTRVIDPHATRWTENRLS